MYSFLIYSPGSKLHIFFKKKGTPTLNIVGKNAWPYKNKMISKVNGSNFKGSHQFV
jgi:hypothetical protein